MNLKEVKILIAEDEMLQRDFLKNYFEEKGYAVLTAFNGEEAFNLYRNNEIDTVISDIQMPKINGLKLVEKVNHLNPDIPIILITAYGTIELAVEALKNGAADFLLKPVDLEKLAGIVERNLERTKEMKNERNLTPFLSGNLTYNLPAFQYKSLNALASLMTNLIIQQGYRHPSQRHATATMLYEVLSNSMFHGTLNIPSEGFRDEENDDRAFFDEIKKRNECSAYTGKGIVARLAMDHQELTITVRDEGNGFNWREKLEAIKNGEDDFSKPYGRGLLIVDGVMGKNFSFNESGNEIILNFRKEDKEKKKETKI